jgi:hypothetical protein
MTSSDPTAPIPPTPPPGPPPAPPGPPGPPAAPTPSGGGGFTLSWKALAIALLAVIVGLGAVVAVVALSGGDEAEAEVVDLEATSTAGENPFMPSVGTDETSVTPPADTGGTFSGDTAGLYGGTLNVASCDATQMVTFLQQNPDKAAAWAGVLGTTVAQIPTYVSELTPVILRSDTYVTNHGFANGRATTIPAVLEAGTAVFVDKYGTPVVKCYCGNPLTPFPKYGKVSYSGPRWGTFTPTSITIIQKTTVIIDTFTLVDPRTGESFTRPRGGNGTNDTPSTPTPTTTLPPQTQPPQTAPPPTAPPDTEPSGPSAEDEALARVQQAANECYPFPAPFEDVVDSSFFTSPGDDPSYFVLTADGTTVSGNQQTVIWHVDRATLSFTPQNELAQVASNHCSLLN